MQRATNSWSGCLRTVAESVAGGPAMTWDEEDCLAEHQLEQTPEGLAALGA